MKIKVGTLRRMINEELINDEFMRGVPEFMLRSANDELIAKLKTHIIRFIQSRAENQVQQREMLTAADETLKELNAELYDDIESKLFSFLQKT